MSPLLDVQRAYAESFRLRLGELRKNDKGKAFPAALNGQIRVTASSPEVVDAFTAVYGGTRRPWGDGDFEAYLPTAALPVMILPGDSLQQWWELWDSGGLLRRCDGHRQTTGQPCACSERIEARMADERQCKPTTRLHVVCPAVAVLGTGLLTTRGLIAGATLPGAIAIAQRLLEQGEMVGAILRVVRHAGRRTYVYPHIEIIGRSLAELMGAERPELAGLPSGEGLPAGAPAGDTPASIPGKWQPAPAALVRRVNIAVTEDLGSSTRETRLARVSELIGREIDSTSELSSAECQQVLRTLEAHRADA